MINLIRTDAANAVGARIDEAGIDVFVPWGYITICDVSLANGWYRLDCVCERPGFTVQLYNVETSQVIELTAAEQGLTYVRLASATYEIRLFAGGRPGHYLISRAHLVRVPVFEQLRTFTRRLTQALRDGRSVVHIAKFAYVMLVGKSNVGIRGDALARIPADKAETERHTILDYSVSQGRLNAVKIGARFLICDPFGVPRPASFTIKQLYPHYHFDENQPFDYRLCIGDDEELTNDALLLFAETLLRNPSLEVVLADVWRNAGEATTRVPWDPILYADSLPTPFAVHAAASTPPAAPARRETAAVISVPVAISKGTVLASLALAKQVSQPRVSIIIPTRDRPGLLRACLESLYDHTDWPFELILIDNGSVEPETLELFATYEACGARVVRLDTPFNFSALCNAGAREANCDYLLFLNNDVVLYKPDWLCWMMSYAQRADVGAVGAKLYYADQRLQHGGVALGLTEACGHIWRGLPSKQTLHIESLQRPSLRAAVTAACLCVAKEKFFAVSGFDEAMFPVTLNDVDLCLKLLERGWLTVFSAYSEALHLEGESRGLDASVAKQRRRRDELMAFSRKWRDWIQNDPWLSQAISRANETGSRRDM